MAEPKTTGANASTSQEKYVFSPNVVIPEDYKTITDERAELIKKQEGAGREFMFQHYARLLREIDKSLERASKVNVKLENRNRRTSAKQKRDALRAQHKQSK
jgi:hypothetical protein